jgi:ribonuclease BN (tRNA processing enzyme)
MNHRVCAFAGNELEIVMPSVTVLGGASAAPNPGQGCSGYLIELGDACLVLDLGPGTLPELRRHTRLERIDALVISHLHTDHILDLVALWWGWLYHPAPLPAPIPLYLPPGGRARLRRILATFGRDDEADRFFTDICDVTEYDPEEALTVAGVHIRFAPTVHYIPCWAIHLEHETGIIAYTADTGPSADLVPLARDADLLIAEAMLPPDHGDTSPERGSSAAAEAARLADNAAVKRLILTHRWAEDDPNVALAEAARVFNGPVHLAERGLVVKW